MSYLDDIKKRIKQNFQETKNLLMFWKWNKDDVREFVRMTLLCFAAWYIGFNSYCLMVHGGVAGDSNYPWDQRCINFECFKDKSWCEQNEQGEWDINYSKVRGVLDDWTKTTNINISFVT